MIKNFFHVKFQLTAARRRLADWRKRCYFLNLFQLTAARRRLGSGVTSTSNVSSFQLTAARRRLVVIIMLTAFVLGVSTHSRPKAAGRCQKAQRSRTNSFNSQPPEGGWLYPSYTGDVGHTSFNSQPPEGGWATLYVPTLADKPVSTHSRPKAAGAPASNTGGLVSVSTHSRPKAAGASAETLNRQGLHCPVSLRFH